MYKSLKDNFNNMIMKGFNINDFIEANAKMSVMGTLKCLRKERFMIAEETKPFSTDLDLSKVDFMGLFQKYSTALIVVKNVLGDVLSYKQNGNLNDMLDIICEEKDNFVKIIMTKDSKLQLDLITKSNVCFAEDCRANVDKKFDEYIWSHGLQAYSSNNGIDNARKIMENNNIEISCSNKEIGPFGIYVKGTCLCVSKSDLQSVVYEGKRAFTTDDTVELINNTEDYSDSFNCEAIVKNFEVVGIWVKSEFANEQMINNLVEILGTDNLEIL